VLAALHHEMARSLVPKDARNAPAMPLDAAGWVSRAMPDGTGVRVVIVCSCNVISDHQVRAVTAANAVRATSEVYRCLGCSAACGRCVRTIRTIVDEVRAETDVGADMAAASPCAEPEPVLAAAE
jgi:bacterioferritin-associated ferredoxin